MFSHDKNLITIKDTTNTGGKVLTASSSIFVDGLNVVCVSDKVKCGIVEHGISSVLTGSTSFFSNGKAVAVDGSKLSCGCYLVKTKAYNFQTRENYLFNLKVKVVDKTTKEILPNQEYKIYLENGEVLQDFTDENGYTKTIKTKKQENIKLELIERVQIK